MPVLEATRPSADGQGENFSVMQLNCMQMKTLKSYDEAMRGPQDEFEEHFIENSPPDIILQNRTGYPRTTPNPSHLRSLFVARPRDGTRFRVGGTRATKCVCSW
jgi:hypothetical protein